MHTFFLLVVLLEGCRGLPFSNTRSIPGNEVKFFNGVNHGIPLFCLRNGPLSICDKFETKLRYFSNGYIYTCHDVEVEINVYISVKKELMNYCLVYLKELGLRGMFYSELVEFLERNENFVQ